MNVRLPVLLQLDDRHRSAKEVALGEVTAQLAQDIQFLGGLDAFAHDPVAWPGAA